MWGSTIFIENGGANEIMHYRDHCGCYPMYHPLSRKR